MKYIALLLCLFLVSACGADAPSKGAGDTVDTTASATPNPAPAPAPKEEPSTTTIPPATPPVDTGTTPIEPNVPALEAGFSQTELAKEACCERVIVDPSECCCDKLYTTLESYLKADDIDAAAEISSNQAYDPCAQKFSDYEDRIMALYDKYLGE
ncbi:MAG: hypothetical protein AAF840_02600 [Bacteroidota bacterium]